MIQLLLPLLILPAQTTAPMEQRYAEPIFKTDFEQAADANYDHWPDNWTRRRGPGYPHYLEIGIAEDPDAVSEGNRCLRLSLDGGAAAAYSPPIEISPQFSYTLQGKLKTAGLRHNVAYLTVAFVDRDRTQKEIHTSEQLTRADSWRELTIGPVTPLHADTRYAIVGLHLAPTSRSDLTGSAMFDDICLARFPTMTLETNRPHNLFTADEEPTIRCTVSGVRLERTVVILELLDVAGRTVLSEQKVLARQDDPVDKLTWPDLLTDATTSLLPDTSHQGTVSWHPQFPDLGYYQVRALLRSDDRITLHQTISVAVVRDLAPHIGGEFGWSLTRHMPPLSDEGLLNLLTMAHVGWVKYPVWYGPQEDRLEGERVALLADRLSATGIEMVGVFDEPPAAVFKRLGQQEHLSVAEAFLEPSLWQPAIDPLLVRLSLKVRWWQLGADDDESFIDYRELDQKIREVRAHFKKYGQRTRLGLPWRWMHAPPASPEPQPPWDFLSMTESPAFTSAELTRYAQANQDSQPHTWVTLTPLPRDQYDYATRTRDLILRMVQSRIDGIAAIFARNPFDETCGLLCQDGTPSELFLPWCMTSKFIGGAEYLGSLQLPHNSPNHVFATAEEAVMVVWNDAPVSESIHLGDEAVQVDPWGRETCLANPSDPAGSPQSIAVGPLPVFVRGIDPAIARWQIGFQFDPGFLQSLYGRRQNLKYRLQNPLLHGVAGVLQLHAPDVWDVRNTTLRFKLGAGESLSQDFSVLLFANASSGPQTVRIDFELFADKTYRFSIYRQVHVGLGDVVAELDTWLDDDGRLIVEQRLTNLTEENLDFNCYLFVPGRRRMRMQVFDIGPGRVTHTFTLPDGKELLGKPLWLRIEEMNGQRLQNYHVTAEP